MAKIIATTRKYKYKKGDIVWCNFSIQNFIGISGSVLIKERCEVVKLNRSKDSILMYGVPSYNLRIMDKTHLLYGRDFYYMTENSLGSEILDLVGIREEKIKELLK